MDHLKITYRIEVDPVEIDSPAASVLVEQTIETPLVVAERYPFVRENMLGRIVEIATGRDGFPRVTFSIPDVNAAQGPAHLLNVLFGNASLHPYVVLEDIELPASMLARYAGPRFGLAGLREILTAPARPLTCTALKPVGLTVEEMAGLCRTFAEGGIDLIKDDHYLSDHAFCPFEERVRACVEVVEEVHARTGHRALYAPHLIGTPDEVARQAELAQALGARAVMLSPMLIGLPVFYETVARRLEVPVLAHPSFGGATRVAEHVLFGRLFRLMGADAVIFANYGGRFSHSKETCQRVADALRLPWDDKRAACPVPAGGMTVERVPELVRFFGPDTMLLIGGSLLEAGDRILERTRAFVAAVHQSVTSVAA